MKRQFEKNRCPYFLFSQEQNWEGTFYEKLKRKNICYSFQASKRLPWKVLIHKSIEFHNARLLPILKYRLNIWRKKTIFGQSAREHEEILIRPVPRDPSYEFTALFKMAAMPFPCNGICNKSGLGLSKLIH